MRYVIVSSISTSVLCKSYHSLLKDPSGYQWARLSFASTLHLENKMKFKLTFEEKCYKEDQVLSNLRSSFKCQEQTY